MKRAWLSRFAAVVRDTHRILAVAWRMDARLTFLYYATAFVAAIAPLASGLTLGALIDRVVVTSPAQVTIPVIVVIVVAMHFAIVAINAAVRFGLHEQYYDYVFRYRLQDTFTYRFCEKLTQLDVPHLEAEYRDKTLTLVSHRFSTVRNADRILVIDDGRIAEHGTHDELLAVGGRYAAMFTAQAAGYR